MSKEQKNKRDRFELLHALEDIRSRYPRIRAAGIERFAPVYYPIAMVEMLLEEQTFEDFETVQLTVLRLAAMGISDYRVIARTLGLSATYVYKVMHLLSGYGHISGTELTELGRQSLEMQKKIVTNETLQKFQVDALNGNLLKRRQVVTSNMLFDRSETFEKIGHLNYLDGIDEQMLSEQISGDSTETFLYQRTGVLHTNVVAIKAARCTEIKYAKCYMLKLRGHSTPIVFAKRYDWRGKEYKNRNPWMPLSVRDDRLRGQCGFEPETLISTPLANEYAEQMDQMMLAYCADPKTNLREEVSNALSRLYPFREDGMTLQIGEAGGCTRAVIREEALCTYGGELISLLQGICLDGMYLLTTQWLHGHIIRLTAAGEKIKYLCELLSDQIDRYGRSAVAGKLKERFRDHNSDGPVTDEMIRCLREMDAAPSETDRH